MQTPAKASPDKSKISLTIAILATVTLSCCLFIAFILVGMGPVIGRVYSSVNASMITTNP